MSDDGNSGLAALGALLGYVGAEATTTSPFEHLLWPNRHLSNLSISSVFAIVALMPMGGPIHKAALEIFDTFYTHGLLLGQQRGHMLGTAFFDDVGWTYTLHDGKEPELKETRNCLWAIALGLLRVPELDLNRQDAHDRQEKGLARQNTIVRAWTSVHHLTFSPAKAEDKNSKLPFVKEGTKTPKLSTFITIILAELTAIIIAVVVAAVWRTPWAALWLAPLILRLLSAIFTLSREPLMSVTDAILQEEQQSLTINCPQSTGSFIVCTGPPTIILQFMRHYGHPVRHRLREMLQLVIVIALGTIFPLGLIVSTLLMSRSLQYVWFGYQIYLVAALHIARYSRFVKNVSTHAAIADAFEHHGNHLSSGRSILFGQKRHGPGTIRVDLVVTYHQRYQDAKQAAERLSRNSIQLNKSEAEGAKDNGASHDKKCTPKRSEDSTPDEGGILQT